MTVEMLVPTTPGQVFAVLADGWSYPLWVVGATHMRDVDDGWPAVGTRLHHSVGAWPLQAQDTTEVIDCRPSELLELRANLWPTGSARIVLTLHAHSAGTRVEMDEYADTGPGVLVPRFLQDLVIAPRNREALSRLAAVAARRGGP